jgi:hypothetical protein
VTEQPTQAVEPPEPTRDLPKAGRAGGRRAEPRRRRIVRRAGAGTLIIAALAAGRVVTTAYGSDDGLSGPFLVAGTVGRPVSLRYAEVTATDVQGSTLVATSPGMTTGGVWLAVPVTIVTKGEPAEVRYAAVEDRHGRTFLANGTRSQFAPGVSQPGLPRYATVLVEVPKDAVEGAHLRIALDPLDQRRDDMADIDLGLTAADAAAWAARTDRLEVREPADTPPSATGTAPTEGTT